MNPVLVGHVTRDIIKKGSGTREAMGGSVYYAAAAYEQLGHRASVMTSGDFDALPTFADWAVDRRPQTTTFENNYAESGRTQRVLETALPVVPPISVEADWVHFAPVIGEVSWDDWSEILRSNRVVVGLQGWMRDLQDGHVISKFPDGIPMFGPESIVGVSEEDLIGIRPGLVEHLRSCFDIVVVTGGVRGAAVYQDSRKWRVASVSVDVRDETGAGDVFLSGFAVGYFERGNMDYACRVATSAASHAVEGEGTEGLGGWLRDRCDQVEVRDETNS